MKTKLAGAEAKVIRKFRASLTPREKELLESKVPQIRTRAREGSEKALFRGESSQLKDLYQQLSNTKKRPATAQEKEERRKEEEEEEEEEEDKLETEIDEVEILLLVHRVSCVYRVCLCLCLCLCLCVVCVCVCVCEREREREREWRRQGSDSRVFLFTAGGHRVKEAVGVLKSD